MQLINHWFDNSPGPDAPGAYVNPGDPALTVLGPNLLQVGQKPSFVAIVGVADIVAYLGPFSANITLLAHFSYLQQYMHMPLSEPLHFDLAK